MYQGKNWTKSKIISEALTFQFVFKFLCLARAALKQINYFFGVPCYETMCVIRPHPVVKFSQ